MTSATAVASGWKVVGNIEKKSRRGLQRKLMIDIIKVTNLVTQLQVADQIEVVGETEKASMEWDDCCALGDPENQVVYLTWEDDNGYLSNTILTEQGLNDAKVSSNSIILNDYEGEEVHLRLWERTPMACGRNLAEGAQFSRMNVGR